MHQVNPQLLGHGVHDGDEDVHGGVGVHKAAGDQEDHVDDDQEHVLVAGHGKQQRLGGLGNAVDRADVGEQSGGADDEHDAAGGLAGVHQKIVQVLDLDLAVDEQAHDQAVHHGDGRRLGGGEDAAVDAAQDDDGHQKAPEGGAEGLPPFAPGGLLPGGGQALAADLDHDDDDQGQTQGNQDCNDIDTACFLHGCLSSVISAPGEALASPGFSLMPLSLRSRTPGGSAPWTPAAFEKVDEAFNSAIRRPLR